MLLIQSYPLTGIRIGVRVPRWFLFLYESLLFLYIALVVKHHRSTVEWNIFKAKLIFQYWSAIKQNKRKITKEEGCFANSTTQLVRIFSSSSSYYYSKWATLQRVHQNLRRRKATLHHCINSKQVVHYQRVFIITKSKRLFNQCFLRRKLKVKRSFIACRANFRKWFSRVLLSCAVISIRIGLDTYQMFWTNSDRTSSYVENDEMNTGYTYIDNIKKKRDVIFNLFLSFFRPDRRRELCEQLYWNLRCVIREFVWWVEQWMDEWI